MSRRPRSELEKQQAITIGKRLWKEARGFDKGVAGFQRALKAAGARGVSTRRELYLKLNGLTSLSPMLLEIASKLLGVRRQWLARGSLPREVATLSDPVKLERERRSSRVRKELTKALTPVVDLHFAEEISRAVVESSDIMDFVFEQPSDLWRVWSAGIVAVLAELVKIAPHLRTAEKLVSITDHLMHLQLHHHLLIEDVRFYGGGSQAIDESWASILATIRRSATYLLDPSGQPFEIRARARKEIVPNVS